MGARSGHHCRVDRPGIGQAALVQHAGVGAPVRWLTPGALAKANTEIMPLHDDLLAMVPAWADLDIPVTDIQGLTDKLVSPKNAAFARSVIRSEAHTSAIQSLMRISYAVVCLKKK